MTTVALVSCTRSKLPETCAAEQLYQQSDWFKKARAYAIREADRWFILSAKHHLLEPDDVIARYECKMPTRKPDQIEWARRVVDQIEERRYLVGVTRVLWLAGEKYRLHLIDMLPGFKHVIPMQGLKSGQQKRWLKQELGW